MKPTKAVVLARGLGTRMRRGSDQGSLTPQQAAAASAGAKAMMLIVKDFKESKESQESRESSATSPGRPFLDYALSALADAGWTDVCLVVAPEHGEVREYYTRVSPPRRVSVSFAVQAEPRGTADALLAAEAFAASERVLVVNGDNYYPVSALRALRDLDEAGTALFARETLVARSNIPAERVRAFALCRISEDGTLAEIVEKPTTTDRERDLVSMNCWLMPPAVFDACRHIHPSVRGELEIADAVTWLMRARAVAFVALVSEEGVLDLSQRSDVAAVSRALEEVAAAP